MFGLIESKNAPVMKKINSEIFRFNRIVPCDAGRDPPAPSAIIASTIGTRAATRRDRDGHGP